MPFFRFSVTFEPHRFLRSVHYHGQFCNNITEIFMFNKNHAFINYPLSYHMYMFIKYVCFYLMILFQYLHWACKDFFSKVGFWVVQGVWLLTYILNAPLAFICDTIYKPNWEEFFNNTFVSGLAKMTNDFRVSVFCLIRYCYFHHLKSF